MGAGAGTDFTFLNMVVMKDSFDVVELDQNSIELGLHDLPRRPTIIVLQPQLLRGP